MSRPDFHPLQAEEIARAFQKAGVEYLFLGKSGAILLGYPGTTQDVDVFPARTPENGRRIAAALTKLGFKISPELENEIVANKDFEQIKTGPFDVDLVFAPDGIDDFAEATPYCRNLSFGEPERHHRQQTGERPPERHDRSAFAGKLSRGIRKGEPAAVAVRRRHCVQATAQG